jgi:hypothetical protein
MKPAGIFAIIFALILGVWTITDAVQGSERRSDDVVTAMKRLPSYDPHDLDRDSDNDRFDGIIGIVAVFALIGGTVLISQSKTNPHEEKRPEPK